MTGRLKHIALFVISFVAIASLGIAESVNQYTWIEPGFSELGSKKNLRVLVPTVPLSPSDEHALDDGNVITRLLEGPTGLKMGYMRFFAPYDPVTTWMVITDLDHFSMVSPDFPKTGSLSDKRNTFMPYVFDSAVCMENNKMGMYQLVIMPFVAPRKTNIQNFNDNSAFPWESSWKTAKSPRCLEMRNPEMQKMYGDRAIVVAKNRGAWLISPLPKKFRRTPADINRSDVIYFVDTNPGGDIGKITALVNKALSVALPAVRDNTLNHCKNWVHHLETYHTPKDLENYLKWKAAYKKAMTEK